MAGRGHLFLCNLLTTWTLKISEQPSNSPLKNQGGRSSLPDSNSLCITIWADALSGQYPPKTSEPENNTLLPSFCFLNALNWELNKQIQSSLPRHLPGDAPLERCFVPMQLQAWLITWVHKALSKSHPRTQHTYSLLSTKYWWPNMIQDINLPTSKLHLLSAPSRPWFHITSMSSLTYPCHRAGPQSWSSLRGFQSP